MSKTLWMVMAVIGFAVTACGGSDGNSEPSEIRQCLPGNACPLGLAGEGPEGTGGSDAETGGSTSTGGGAQETGGRDATGGEAGSTGGSNPETGGNTTTGGNAGTGGNAATGGSNVTGGTSGSTGGNAQTGGSSTGGNTSTGGNAATGGSNVTGGTSGSTGGSSTGGSNPETGGNTTTGGNAGTGGTSETGGSTATGGSPETGGTPSTGGTTQCVPSPRPPVVAEVGDPIDCANPVLDTSFGVREMNGEIACISSGECFIASGEVAMNNEILRRDLNGAWVKEALPASVVKTDNLPYDLWLNGVTGTRLDNMWAAGNFGGTPKVLRRAPDGTWSEQLNGLESNIDWRIVDVDSVWASETGVFISTQEHNPCLEGCTTQQAEEADVGIHWWNGESWNAMDLPPHGRHITIFKMWGASDSDVFAVGCNMTVSDDPEVDGDCESAVLWHWDGCAWSDLSGDVDEDVRVLSGVHGANGYVAVTGAARVAEGGNKGVRYISTDLNSWTRVDGALHVHDGAVWMRGANSLIVSGSAEIDNAGNVWPGSARLTVKNGSGWENPVSIDATSVGVSGISETDGIVYIAVQGQGARVYTCQQ